jgi:hypothetical protein
MQGKMSFALTFILIYLHTLSLHALIKNEDEKPVNTNQTIIETDLPKNNTGNSIYYKDKNLDRASRDTAILFHVPGLTVTENSGPLSIASINYRGLANARFPISIEGLSLNNPMNGLCDANAMFLFAAQSLDINSQSLLVTLPVIDQHQARAVLGYGSLNSFKLGLSTGFLLGPSSSLYLAAQASSTDGAFSFHHPYLTNGQFKNNFTRENNDQHRLQALAKYQRQTSSNRFHALLAVNAHEGGIAGYAFSPTKNLRTQTIYSGLSVHAAKKFVTSELSLKMNNSVFDYKTSDLPENNEHLMASTHELILGFKRLGLPEWLDVEFFEHLILDVAYDLEKTRIGGGFSLTRTIRWSGAIKPKAFGNFSILGFHRHGLVMKSDFGISIEPIENLSITGRFIRNQRLPTFMEMYANNRFFMGNADLKKESVWDIELSTQAYLLEHAKLKLTGYLGYLSDIIVYTQYLASMVRPINVETAQRYGVDLSLIIEPYDWLGLETNNSILFTKNKATNAPLPNAPSFLGIVKARFGDEDKTCFSLQSRYRSSSTSDSYGRLKSSPYAIFDAALSTRLLGHMVLSISINNIFNVKTARDVYEIPLPGTIIFGQIEIGNAL